jgi:hypothetical protein
VENRQPEERKTGKDAADDVQYDAVNNGLREKLSTESQLANTAMPAAGGADKFLPSVALWQEGGSHETSTDIGPGFGWSAKYAANFDRENEVQHLDLAPVLGLPQGTDHDKLVMAATQQEDELLKELLS